MVHPVGTLLVDARPLDHPAARQRGIGRYVGGLLHGLHTIGAPVVALHASEAQARTLAALVPGLELCDWSDPALDGHAAGDSWFISTQLMLGPITLDPIPQAITERRMPVAAVMYDVIPYRYPETYQRAPRERLQAQLRAVLARTADALLAISQFSATTAAEELGFPTERIGVIGAGVDEQFVPPTVRSLPRPDRVLPPEVERYVVSVTGGDERKNTEGLLRAWAQVAPDVRRGRWLVIATSHSPIVLARWQGWAAELGITDDVVFTGAITDDEMVAILQRAELSVMPSTEEGFGLPIVEAAACGCPVICSGVTSLPEVLREPRAEFDPYDPASIARAIERALTDGELRTALADAGRIATQRWTWEHVARDLIDALGRFGPRW